MINNNELTSCFSKKQLIIPTEIINIILVYISELNNDIIITQYHPISNKVYYKINFCSDLLWRMKATLRMKRIYPIYDSDITDKKNIELYKHGIHYYEEQIRKEK